MEPARTGQIVTTPTHLIMVINRETCDLKLVSAHDEHEAEAAFQNLSALFATTPNDVHKVTIPVATGFCIGEIKSSQGAAAMPPLVEHPGMHIQAGAIITDNGNGPVTLLPKGDKPKNGIHRNDRGEYVERLADGSEIISVNDFSE